MHLQHRIGLMVELGKYISSGNPSWQAAKQKAYAANPWFTPAFIDTAARNIADRMLQPDKLQAWAARYNLPAENHDAKNIGIVMAGNIPLVGFHDFLSVFISGHRQTIRPSSKDEVLLQHIVQWLYTLDGSVKQFLSFAPMLKNCDAYIATGSNNSARYFEYYFGKYPNIIRRNRTSVAILRGNETREQLEKLADDALLYFGLGCRNVTQIYVPDGYDFIPLLEAFKKYSCLTDHHKYRNNYDYQLALLILNKTFYMTNGSVILTENISAFSPISVLHAAYYRSYDETLLQARQNADIQCIIGEGGIALGESQKPGLMDYADGIDSLNFLCRLHKVAVDQD